MVTTSKKSRWANALLLAVSVAVSFAVLEAVVRVVDPPFFTNQVQYHPDLGWVGEPDTVTYPRSGGRIIRVQYNELGFRDVRHTESRPSAVRRMVVIGDSFSNATQVEMEEVYWSVLKRRLNQRGAAGYWDVVNLGVGGFGTAQELVALERYGMGYRPDLVILQVFPYNDVLNNSLSAAYLLNPHDSYRPYLDPDGDFETLTYVNPATSWLRRRSHLFRFSFLVLNRTFGAWGDERYFPDQEARERFAVERFGRPELPEARLRSAISMNALAPPDHQLDAVREGWAATDAAIRKIHRTAREGGAELVVVVIPFIRLIRGPLHDLRGEVPFPTDLRYPEERIRELLPGEGVPVVGLTDVFEENVDLLFPIPAGHLNAPTHELMARTLLPEVERLFPPGKLVPAGGR